MVIDSQYKNIRLEYRAFNEMLKCSTLLTSVLAVACYEVMKLEENDAKENGLIKFLQEHAGAIREYEYNSDLANKAYGYLDCDDLNCDEKIPHDAVLVLGFYSQDGEVQTVIDGVKKYWKSSENPDSLQQKKEQVSYRCVVLSIRMREPHTLANIS
ncbi:unnamed protein product [Cylicocyclus nassatus]|uniref:Uncharacterized protein n=1 Tax=Cylicocyclus nassatus TaxID=53992 RepID=A0AA36GD91_CYLNA|nr:unnamed protein product [Cylicocyclus nassatus]